MGKADDRRKHAKRSKYGKALVKATIGDALSGVPTRERRRPLAHQKLAVHPLVETSDRLRRLQNWRSVPGLECAVDDAARTGIHPDHGLCHCYHVVTDLSIGKLLQPLRPLLPTPLY